MTNGSNPEWRRLISFFKKEKLVLFRFKGLMIGIIVGFTLVENVLFLLLNQSIQVGELPPYSANIAIIILSIAELLMGPYVSWLGYKRRRNVMVLWMLVASVTTALLWLLPDTETSLDEDEEICAVREKFITKGITSSSIIRVLIILVVGCTYCLARIAVFSHAIAYMAEHSLKKFSAQIGVFIYCRVLMLIMGHLIVKDLIKNYLWIQVLIFVITMLTNIPHILMYPRVTPETITTLDIVHVAGQGFLDSTGRVLRNKLLMSQVFAMAFLIAAVFGLMYNSNDIIKSQYFMVESKSRSMIFAAIIRYKLIFFGVMYYGCLHSEPLMASFDKMKTVKTATFINVLTVIVYVVMALLKCEKGNVAGLLHEQYVQPQCSLSCECIQPWIKFSPICVVDEMTTYFSPCHAGCTTSEDISGAKFLSNCTCAENNGRATIGACSDNNCTGVFELFKMLQLAALAYTMVAIQMQWTTVLQCCESRDRAVSFGVASAATSLIAFIFTHIIYTAISVYTCLWSEGGICHLQNSIFPKAVSFTSAILALISLTISVTTFVILKRKQKKEEKSEERNLEL